MITITYYICLIIIFLLNTMIKKIVTFVFCLPLLAIAQQKNLNYNQVNDINFVKQFKNNTVIDSYTTKDGITIRVGDTLTIGYAINDKQKYMHHDVFSHIVIGKNKSVKNKEFRYLPHNYTGNKVIVKSLFVTHEKFNGYKLFPKRKEMPLFVSIFISEYKAGISKIFSHSRKTILDIEKALSTGEMIFGNALLLNNLKGNKLVDLEGVGKYDLLLKLGRLKESGILTEQEFQEEKKKILDSE